MILASPLLAEWEVGTGFIVVACVSILLLSLALLRTLLGPLPKYRISSVAGQALDSDEFLYMLEALTDSKVNHRTRLEVFTNGDSFYEAELAEIAGARRSVCWEAYIFHRGEIAQRVIQALAERARAGEKVNLLLDGLGNLATTEKYLHPLCAAGGKVAWYNPARWYTVPTYNNRTHRELLTIDGRVGFIGGAGVADQWYVNKPKQPRWRDTMVRVEGDAVPNMQAAIAENWLEAYGELLAGPDYFPIYGVESDAAVLVVSSTPSAGGAARNRILMQTLIASALHRLDITTPYFLPDASLRQELARAARERNVKVRIVVPGPKTDHYITRQSSRGVYGELLQAGVEIYEYERSMIHAKVLLVDGLWAVVGSTNMDHRSFGLNDEVNLAARDIEFTARLERDFAQDVAQSRAVRYDDWRRRSLAARAPELIGWVLQRQQ